jgi:hypothetical protein
MTTIRFEPGALRLCANPQFGQLFFYGDELLMILRQADGEPEARRKVLTLRSPNESEVLTVQVETAYETPFADAPVLDVKRWEFELPIQPQNARTVGSSSLGEMVLTNKGLAIVCRLHLARPGPIVLVDPINGTVIGDDGTTSRAHFRGWKLHALTAKNRWFTVAEEPAAKAT